MSLEVRMFQEGVEPLHTHANCANCMSTRRCDHNLTGLSKCARCLMVYYCSRKCQTSHWHAHKAQCKVWSIDKDRVNTASGNDEAWSHLVSWMQYYDTHLKNCALAAYSQRPDVAETHVLIVSAMYQRGPNIPIKHRFKPVTIAIDDQFTPGPYQMQIASILNSPQRTQLQEAGRIEFGSEFSALGHYLLVAAFETTSNNTTPFMPALIPKAFAIDKRHAQTPGISEWWLLLRSYIEKGQKIKFCCGKLNTSEITSSTCCCGGWVHDQQAKTTFKELRDNLNNDLD